MLSLSKFVVVGCCLLFGSAAFAQSELLPPIEQTIPPFSENDFGEPSAWAPLPPPPIDFGPPLFVPSPPEFLPPIEDVTPPSSGDDDTAPNPADTPQIFVIGNFIVVYDDGQFWISVLPSLSGEPSAWEPQ